MWASWGGTAMLQTAVRVVESPSPLLVIVSLFSARQDRQDWAYLRIRWMWSPWHQSLCQVRTALAFRLSCPLDAISTSWADAIATRYPNTAIPGIDQYPNSRNTCSATMQAWKTTQNGCKVRCAQGWELFSMRSDLGPRRLCAEMNVNVRSTVTSCDVTYRATT